MLNLSTTALIEKNKMHGTGAWIILLEIKLSDTETLRVCRNTEDVIWNGYTWIAFPFELDDLKEDMKEFPEIAIKVDNTLRTLQPYLEQYKGLTGKEVIIRVVHQSNLNTNICELEEYFTITNTSADANFVEFTLGGDFPINMRVPNDRYMKNFCNHIFKSIPCGYNGAETWCDGTLARCKQLNNSARFGGFPAIPMGGVYL